MKGVLIFCILGIVFSTVESLNLCIGADNDLSYKYVNLDKLKNDIKQNLADDNKTICIDHGHINFDHPALALDGNFTDLCIANLTDIGIDLLNIISVSEIELVNITFFNISMKGYYDMYGTVGQLFDIFGNGSFWANLVQLSVSVKTRFDQLSLKQICIPITINVDVQKVENDFENIMDSDDILCPLMNFAISSVGREAVGIIWDEIMNKIDGDPSKMVSSILLQNKRILSNLINMASKKSSSSSTL